MAIKTSEYAFATQKEKICMILRESDHLMTAKEIANILGISPQRASALLNSLVKEGVIIRPYNHNDLSNHTNHSKTKQTKEIPMEYKIYLKLLELVKKFKKHLNPPVE